MGDKFPDLPWDLDSFPGKAGRGGGAENEIHIHESRLVGLATDQKSARGANRKCNS